MMQQIKWIITFIFAAVLALFMVQNAAAVEYDFLAWTIELRRSVVVLLCVLIGMAIGWMMGANRRRS